MKVIGVIMVDVQRSPLGTRSRLRDDLVGIPVLRRTLDRAARAKRLASVHVVAPASQAGAVADLAAGLPVRIETHAGNPPPYAELVRASRVWALDGWRGGIGSLCAFDEDIHVAVAAALAASEGADAIALIPAAAALIDPALIDAMVEHYQRHGHVFRISFVQAPPGLAPTVFGRTLLEELATAGQPPGAVLTYRPGQPAPDLAGREACYRPEASIIEARGRLICDTRRSYERVRRLIEAAGDDVDGVAASKWLRDVDSTHAAPAPEEIEIELTTADPWKGGSLLHPGSKDAPGRGPIEPAIIAKIVESLADWDDLRIVLGGFGEPTAHPRLAEIIRIVRQSPVMAMAIRTSGLLRDGSLDATLFDAPVDAVEVMIDAASGPTYYAVNGVDGFDCVVASAEHWFDLRLSRKQVRPLIVPSFVKARENLHELEAFYDGWVQRHGTGLVTGYSHRAGQLADRAVTSLSPPQRGPCRRVSSRMLVLADGRVTICDQDFAGKQVIGSILSTSLTELWKCEHLKQIRRNDIAALPLCASCDEWHRP